MKPGIGIVELEKLAALPEKELEFHIWYLKEKGWIQRLDTGGFAITVNGVDAVIEKDLLLRKDRFLPAFNDLSSDEEESEEHAPSTEYSKQWTVKGHLKIGCGNLADGPEQSGW